MDGLRYSSDVCLTLLHKGYQRNQTSGTWICLEFFISCYHFIVRDERGDKWRVRRVGGMSNGMRDDEYSNKRVQGKGKNEE